MKTGLKFKVGDKVYISKDDDSKLTDLESDLILEREDGSISGKAFGALVDAITDGEQFTVSSIEPLHDGEMGYVLSLGKYHLYGIHPESLLTTEKPT